MVPGWSLWFFKVPGGYNGFRCFFIFFMVAHGFMSFLYFFQDSRLGFHNSRWVLRVIHGSRSVFIVPGRFFIVSSRFSWFLWFFEIPG